MWVGFTFGKNWSKANAHTAAALQRSANALAPGSSDAFNTMF